MIDRVNNSRQYYLAQLFFWGSYLLLNLIFVRLLGSWAPPALLIFVVLSLLLFVASHFLRYLYKRFASSWSLFKVSLNLVWILPLLALLAQSALYLLIYFTLQLMPSLWSGMQRSTVGGFVGYSINTCIMLVLWSIVYLLRAEFKKRRNAEVAHWQLQVALKDAELHFLRSQINSHFLFNALNNLRSLIREDAERARAGLTDLAALLRGLLQADPGTKVKLRDELEWVRGYLALETLQFESRLHTAFSVDSALLNQELPPMILQTLVENAVKHGIAARRDGGTIQISATMLNDKTWQLVVTNPPAENAVTHAGNGIGLRNARQRLKLAFGDKAKFSLIMNELVTATVELPL